MKKKLLIPTLAATVLLTACSTTTQSSQSTSTATSTTVSTTKASNSTANTEYFTETDLDATYDEASAAKVTLSGQSAQVSGDGVAVDGSTITISAAGTYVISGKSDGLQLVVDAADEDKVKLVLKDVTMTGSDALINVKNADKVVVTSAKGTTNTFTDSTHATDDYSAAIYSKSDITFNGEGTLVVEGNDNNAIKGSDDVKFTGGTYQITSTVKHAVSANDALNIKDSQLELEAAEDALHSDNEEDTEQGNLYIQSGNITINAQDDAIHASNQLTIDGGTIDIESSVEGLEGKVITVNDGKINITASDDGINATDWANTGDDMAAQEGVAIHLNGGNLSISMAQGDTDAVDSNGDLFVTGGTITISGQSAFDFNGTVSFTGGDVTVNGEKITEITESMPGGMGGGPMGGGPGQGRSS